MSKQRTVNPSSRARSDGGNEEENSEEEDETKTFFFQYVSSRAQRDKDISSSDAEFIREEGHRAVRTCRTEGSTQAVNVASRLADLGELDIDYS